MKRSLSMIALLMSCTAAPAMAQDRLEVGEMLEGSIAADDLDGWTGELELDSETSVQIDVIPGTASPNIDLTLELQSADGEWLFDDDGGQEVNPRLVFSTEEGGRFALRVRPFDENTGGTFTLIARESSFAMPELVELGQAGEARDLLADFNGGMGGVYSFEAEAGALYRLSTMPAGDSSQYIDTTIAVSSDRGGNDVAAYDDDGGNGLFSNLLFLPESSGTYFITLGDLNGAQGGQAHLRFEQIPVEAPVAQGIGSLPTTLEANFGQGFVKEDFDGNTSVRRVSLFSVPMAALAQFGESGVEVSATASNTALMLQIGFETPLGFAPVRSGQPEYFGYEDYYGVDAAADAVAVEVVESVEAIVDEAEWAVEPDYEQTVKVTLTSSALERLALPGSSSDAFGELVIKVIGLANAGDTFTLSVEPLAQD